MSEEYPIGPGPSCPYEAFPDSHILREMQRTLDYIIFHKANEHSIEAMREVILHQQLTEEIAYMIAKDGPGGQGKV